MGYIEAQCSVTARCASCEGEHQTTSHMRPVEGYQSERGQTCPHVPFQGRVFVERKEDALRTAHEWQDLSGTVWTDGSKLESGRVGAAVAFWERGRWARRGTYLGTKKEVSDAEVFTILPAVRLLSERDEAGQSYTIFSDSQAAIARIQHDRCGPALALAKTALATVEELHKRCNRGGHQPTWGLRGMSKPTRRPGTRQRRGKTESDLTFSGRPASPTLCGRQLRPGLRPQAPGSETTLVDDPSTDPLPGVSSARGWQGFKRSWRDVFTSLSGHAVTAEQL